MNKTNILLRHNYIPIPDSDSFIDQELLATVMMNLSYYGYALDINAYLQLNKLDTNGLIAWWKDIETELKSITGDDRKIADFVVYKNFPAEVLEKSEAEYWVAQTLMYWGFPNDFFTQEVKPRETMNEQPKAIVLKRAKEHSLQDIMLSYLRSPARWKEQELQDVLFLSKECSFNLSVMGFKENVVQLVSHLIANNQEVSLSTATDVLRLAAGLSDGDVSLREKVKFISFKKPMRRFLLSTLEKCNNLSEDMARRPELWKRLIHQLHPGDYKKQFPKVCKAMDDLYHDRLTTFNSKIEGLLGKKDPEALTLLAKRPGDFRRRLAHTLNLFGDKAITAFIDENVLSKLTTFQLVSLRSHLETLKLRVHRVFPPKGNWNKLRVEDAKYLDDKHVEAISNAITKVIQRRVPKVKLLDAATKMVKLPNNSENLYARGTVFPIPNDIEFIRSASYWQQKNKRGGNTWFDNGWNFFDTNWKTAGSCSWTQVNFNQAAVFSGDPTNSKEMEGKAAQLIDLYLPKLKAQGVRYAVWSILCFSRIPFSDAIDVFAALQWGKDPQKGKLFEPSRCQLAFPLTSKQLTKYISLIDLEKREMIYLDANLNGNVSTASSNNLILEKIMPAFMEYVNSLPSVHDLFRASVSEDSEISILYSDKETELKDTTAYVFKPENKANKYKPLNLNILLA